MYICKRKSDGKFWAYTYGKRYAQCTKGLPDWPWVDGAESARVFKTPAAIKISLGQKRIGIKGYYTVKNSQIGPGHEDRQLPIYDYGPVYDPNEHEILEVAFTISKP